MRKYKIYKQVLFIGVLLLLISCNPLFNSCNPFNCEVIVNENFIENSCGLYNGVVIEKLEVLKTDSINMPLEFNVTTRVVCYNPGSEENSNYIPDKLYLNKINGHYLWSVDTVDSYYRMVGRKRERIGRDSTEQIPKWETTSMGKIDYEYCPINFETSTWYFLNFYDQHFAALFLYVDSQKKFKIYKVRKGLSPV